MQNVAFKGIYIPEGYPAYLDFSKSKNGGLSLVVTGDDKKMFKPFKLKKDGEIKFRFNRSNGVDNVEFGTRVDSVKFKPVETPEQKAVLQKLVDILVAGNKITMSQETLSCKAKIVNHIISFLKNES